MSVTADSGRAQEDSPETWGGVWARHRQLVRSLVSISMIAALVAGSCLAIQLRAVGDPRVDSSIFITGAMHLNSGKALYTEVWDHKQPVIFCLNAVALRMGEGTLADIRLMEKLFAVTAVLLFYLIVWYEWRSAMLSFVGATLFCYQFYCTSVFERGNLTEEYATVFVLAGVLCILIGRTSKSRTGMVLAGSAGFFFFDRDGHSEPFSKYCVEQIAPTSELGLHGYNHVPLTVETWGGKSNMVAALREAARRWESDQFGPQPISYAPPNNHFDRVGAQAITEAIPSIRVICSSYVEQFEKGGQREFGPEPWNPKIFALPRVTWGYEMTPELRMSTTSALNMMGVWTHFLHADDVFDNPRNRTGARDYRNPKALSWRSNSISQQRGLYDQFRQWIEFAKSNYPWLRFMRTEQAYQVIKQHLQNQVHVTFEPDRIVIQSRSPTYLHVRINDDHAIDLDRVDQGTLVHRTKGSDYTMTTFQLTGSNLELPLMPKSQDAN